MSLAHLGFISWHGLQLFQGDGLGLFAVEFLLLGQHVGLTLSRLFKVLLGVDLDAQFVRFLDV